MLEIKNLDQDGQGVFFIGEDGQRLAEMNYRWVNSDTLVIERTWVDNVLRGQNIGRQLVEQAIDLAQRKNAKIVAKCAFAKAVFEKDPSLQDALVAA